MSTEVIMPQMGESIAEGTITRWLVQVGEKVERDQPLFEISTDKVDAEIPSPATGVLLEIRYEEGATVAVDEVVALLGEPGEDAADSAPAEEAVEDPADGLDETVVEVGEEAAESVAEEVTIPEAPGSQAGGAGLESEPERIRRASSPVVRKMAAEHGIDLGVVEGTGVHGRVTKRDLENYLQAVADGEDAPPAPAPVAEEVEEETKSVAAAVAAPPRPPAVEPSQPAFSVSPYGEGEPVEIVPMSKIRQITAAHMAYSKATSAHVTTVFHVDLSRVARIRGRAKERFAAIHGTKLTYMPFLFQAVCGALKSFPQLNAAIDGTDIVYKKEINLGMAVALDRGLIVPVLRNADQLNLVGLAKTANDLADRARSKRLLPDEVQRGTFTVTNPGVFGSLFGTPVINQPQVAILGIGTIEKRPIVVTDGDGNDTIAIKTMSYFALTFDHRLIDGADADHFMATVKRTLAEESWSELDSFVG